MKRCPTCSRSYDDETLSFCLEDGAPLVRDSASRADSQETLVTPSPTLPTLASGLRPTQPYAQLPGKATVNASQFNVPLAQGYGLPTKPRRTWLWIVAILAILFLVIAAVVMAIVIPPMLQASNSNNDDRPKPTPSRSISTTTPTPDAEPTERWGVPDDEDEVLAQLTKLEEEWTEANVKGDKEALERILADEYVGGDNGRNKREYIDTLKPDPSIKSWEISEVTVVQDGDRATVKGILKDETATGKETYEFTDKFVWRDQRWQAVASKTTRVR